ncbi:MAG: hypothetical protein NC308_11230 [Clostridium sp.]|nr:chondroitinase [Bacteroides sp.]MCM1199449.1 hypothetical protein [Clostridium sp.]
MKRIIAYIVISTFAAAFLSARQNPQYGFENGIPEFISVTGHGEVTSSTLKYKDGSRSLCLRWSGAASFVFDNPQGLRSSAMSDNGGIIIWIYSTDSQCSPLRFNFTDGSGNSICHFGFNMGFRGWRTAWIKWDDMHTADGKFYGDLPKEARCTDISRMEIIPDGETCGTIYIDRLSFVSEAMHSQITPDMQIPDNNSHLKRQLWHWARLWEWEQYPEIAAIDISPEQKEMVCLVEQRLDRRMEQEAPGIKMSARLAAKADSLYSRYRIGRLADGQVTGAPLLCDDEFIDEDGEMRIRHIQDILWYYAAHYLRTGDTVNIQKAIDTFDHAIDQGFAFGSGMGTNHHYGYQTRNIFKAAWILRKEFAKAGRSDEYIKVLRYWSGAAETRLPFQYGRDELLDSWNTLNEPKVISIMLSDDSAEKYHMMKAFGKWLSASMSYSPGTLGGFKVDGTAFHHGGHYPAYSTGAFAALGYYASLTEGTDFGIDVQARRNFKHVLMCMRDYCNTFDWGIGISGRHPFNGRIPKAGMDAFGRLALLGHLTSSGMDADPELGGAYLSFVESGGASNKEITGRLRQAGVTPLPAEEGFRVYNYGAFGIHRRDGWMVTLKAYNSDVWNSEIYEHDNRYGRYQSYGSVQITGSGEPVSAKASGFSQEGWDWNRMPGTTAVHLPFELLDSPNKGTLMERNVSRFPGVSSLEGRNGCMAFTFTEKDRRNFCPGATAFKSVFCFDNRIVFIGSGITNSSSFNTETTLFQLAMEDRAEPISINGMEVSGFPFTKRIEEHGRSVLADTKGNVYVLPDGYGLTVVRQEQSSPSDTGRKTGKGDFIAAYIDHGPSPAGASYEYMILVSPTPEEAGRWAGTSPYQVIYAEDNAHAVKDLVTGTEAYVSYSGYNGSGDIAEITPETIVMRRQTGKSSYIMSVCTPDLGITRKGYTTPQKSQMLERTVILKGKFVIESEGDAARSKINGRHTMITAMCVDGQPVEFKIRRK